MVLQFPRLKTALAIFVLVIGHAPQPVQPDGGLTSIIAAAVSATATLTSSGISGLAAVGYTVTCVFEVKNWSRYTLLYPTVRLNSGYLNKVPMGILPGNKETLATHKTAHTATGTSGTVSWKVLELNRTFVLMWSNSYSYDFYSNWLGLGMTKREVTSSDWYEKLFDKMYYDSSDEDLDFRRAKFYDRADPLIYRDNEVEIVGMMSNTHKAEIRVVFRPILEKWKTDLAPSILTNIPEEYFESFE